MNKFCWLLRRSQEGVTGSVELWPQNTKPAHQCRWSRALPLANHVSDVVGKKKKKKLPFSSRMCTSYTLNYPMMTLQMQHMRLWPQVPTTVISFAFHQSFSAACSRHSVLGSSCSPKPRTPALHPLWKRVSSRKLTSLLMQTPSSYSWVNWKAWLMFTMQPACIRGILPNALAEVIPKIIIRQFLRAIHGLKWHFPQVTSLMGISFTQHISI